MNKYYSHYYRPFGNTYNLYSVDQTSPTELQALADLRGLHPADSIEQITAKDAKGRVTWTNWARAHLNEPYGDTRITPMCEVAEYLHDCICTKRNYDEERWCTE